MYISKGKVVDNIAKMIVHSYFSHTGTVKPAFMNPEFNDHPSIVT